jgi:hydroxyacylglutathione hydrolase
MAQCQQLRDRGLPTLPSALAQERSFNPFLQALDLKGNPTLTLHLAGFPAEEGDSLSVFTALRTLRNDFS